MTEVFFYHLLRQRPEAVLPRLLERGLAQGWRALVRVRDEARVAALDDALWVEPVDGFLPHGRATDPDAAEHPVVIAAADGNPNGAAFLLVLDGVSLPADLAPFGRVALVFEETDGEARAAARGAWRALKERGHAVSYWQESERGGWEKKA